MQLLMIKDVHYRIHGYSHNKITILILQIGGMKMYYVDPVIKEMFRTYQPEGRAPYIRLDQNENPDGVPDWLFDEVMKKITPEYLSLYPEEIIFRGKLTKLLGLEDGQLTLTDGSVVAMSYVIKVFGEPGKKLLCVSPTFGMYKVYADMQQMETKFINYEPDYTVDVNKFIDAIDDDTSVVSLVNPSMPIGNVYTDEEIEAVVEKAAMHDAVVIIDEAYHYFYDKDSLGLIDKYENVVILRTFSKMLSIPGLRLGMVISNKQNIQYVNNLKPHYTINNVALAFGEGIVDNFDRLLPELKAKFEAGKDYIFNELNRNDYSYIPSHGCFVCIKPKYKTAEIITGELKNKFRILIFCGKGDSAGFLRVTIWDKKYMKQFMDALLQIDV